MNKKVLCTVMFVIAMVIGNSISIHAVENIEINLLQETIDNLEKGYSEYYDVFDTDTTLISNHEANGIIENLYLLEMDVVLKANNVNEMDYYRGIVEYCEGATMNVDQIRTIDNQQRMEMLSSEQLNIYKELEGYIGERQVLVFYVKETYPVDNETQREILFENGIEYVSWETMLPESHEEIKENGFLRMEDLDNKHISMIANSTEQTRSSYSYSIADAVSYMMRYTSNPTECNACGQECDNLVDIRKYNLAYTNYADIHSDCANYVSQALCEGGIPTDSTWKAASSTWINVSNLTKYMTSNGYWTSVSYNTVQKGDVVSYTSGSHVVMITAFDGTTYKYSGHTNDRLNATITINSATASKYKFYRVG